MQTNERNRKKTTALFNNSSFLFVVIHLGVLNATGKFIPKTKLNFLMRTVVKMGKIVVRYFVAFTGRLLKTELIRMRPAK